MRAFVLSAFASVLAVGCSGGGFEGKVVDGMTAAPLAGVEVIAKATGEVRLTCQNVSGVTDDQGLFTLEGLCSNETAYKLVPANDSLFFADLDEIPQGGVEGPVEVKAWLAPDGSGIYKLTGGELDSIPTNADVTTETIYMTESKVNYPKTIPATVPLIGPGEYLVITGKSNYEEQKCKPLIHTDTRRFGDDKSWVDMEPWWYIGTKFTSDTDFERVESTPNTGKFIDLAKGERMARMVPHDALPAGRYVLSRGDDARRVIVIDFGAAPSEEKAAE